MLTTKHWSLSHTRWSVQVKTEVSNEKAGGLTPIRRLCVRERERERERDGRCDDEWEERPWDGGAVVITSWRGWLWRGGGGGRSERPTKSRRTHFTLLHWSCLTHRPMGCFQLLSPGLSHSFIHIHTHTHTHTHNNKKNCHLIAINLSCQNKFKN